MLPQRTRHLAAHRAWLAAATVAALTAGTASTASAATIFKIDINQNNTNTASGWDGVVPGTSVSIDGVTFDAVGSAITRTDSNNDPDPDALLADFVFAGSVVGVDPGLEITDLPEGVWDVELWSLDSQFTIVDQIIGIKDADGETLWTTDFDESATAPFTYQFDTADYANTFTIFARGNDGNENEINRSRVNALQLTLIPEPASVALVGLGGIMIFSRRRR